MNSSSPLPVVPTFSPLVQGSYTQSTGSTMVLETPSERPFRLSSGSLPPDGKRQAQLRRRQSWVHICTMTGRITNFSFTLGAPRLSRHFTSTAKIRATISGARIVTRCTSPRIGTPDALQPPTSTSLPFPIVNV